jgi:hypothetical protein
MKPETEKQAHLTCKKKEGNFIFVSIGDWNSSVGVDYTTENWGSSLGKDRFFSSPQRRDRLWSQSSPLRNEYYKHLQENNSVRALNWPIITTYFHG